MVAQLNHAGEPGEAQSNDLSAEQLAILEVGELDLLDCDPISAKCVRCEHNATEGTTSDFPQEFITGVGLAVVGVSHSLEP